MLEAFTVVLVALWLLDLISGVLLVFGGRRADGQRGFLARPVEQRVAAKRKEWI